MGCDLHDLFGGLAERVPDGPPGYPHVILHAGVLPAPPVSISTDRILFRKLYHEYNGWSRVDALWMYLSPSKCRELGLYLLAAGFHGPKDTITLSFAHPESEIRRLRLRETNLRLEDPPVGFSEAPFALRYYPAETAKHPWIEDCGSRDLPVFALSNAEDCVGARAEDWTERDTVWMGPYFGTFRFAELLLNAGCSWNTVREYALEGDAGFRGVGPMSAELRIFLPGSDGWIFPEDDVPIPKIG